MSKTLETFRKYSIELTPSNVHRVITEFEGLGFRLTEAQKEELVEAALIGCEDPPEAA